MQNDRFEDIMSFWILGWFGLMVQRLPAIALPSIDLRQVVHTHAPLSPSSIFSTGRGAVMLCGWGGNSRLWNRSSLSPTTLKFRSNCWLGTNGTEMRANL